MKKSFSKSFKKSKRPVYESLRRAILTKTVLKHELAKEPSNVINSFGSKPTIGKVLGALAKKRRSK